MAVKKKTSTKRLPKAPTLEKEELGPRLVNDDSHDVVVEPDGKVVYIARKPEQKPLTQAEVCERAGASDPRKYRGGFRH